MGAKSAIIMYAHKPPRHLLHGGLVADESTAETLVATALPHTALTGIGTGNLAENSRPAEGLVYAARFPGVDVIACDRFMIDDPRGLPQALFELAEGRAMYVHFRHSVVDWLAFGEYRDGEWRRLLSLAPDSGIIVDIGQRLPCEAAYWDGKHPVDPDPVFRRSDDYPLPFHPLELAEDVMAEHLGFTLEGVPTALDPFDLTLHGFRLEPMTNRRSRVRPHRRHEKH